jgi:hypothetical protein
VKALDKAQQQDKATLVDAIREANSELEVVIDAYNLVLAKEKAKVQEKLAAVNAKVREAKEWAEGIAADMQNYYDEKSENWQEGEKGQNYDSWKTDYENFSPDDLEIDFPDDLEVIAADAADDLENLPDEP